jgi:hypothetical protein
MGAVVATSAKKKANARAKKRTGLAAKNETVHPNMAMRYEGLNGTECTKD